MKKMSKKDRIKIQRRMLRIQTNTIQSMKEWVDELKEEHRDTKAAAFDMLRECR